MSRVNKFSWNTNLETTSRLKNKNKINSYVHKLLAIDTVLITHYCRLQSLLRTADQLKIKGLCEVPEDDEEADTDDSVTAAEYSMRRHHDSSRRHGTNTKFKNKYSTQLKRKMHFDHHSASNRKYFGRDKLPGVNDYVTASTINTNDILDTSRTSVSEFLIISSFYIVYLLNKVKPY